MKEKEHEEYFANMSTRSKLLPIFEKVSGWGKNKSFSDIDLNKKYPVDLSDKYCEYY